MPRVQTPAHLRREYECIFLLDQECDEPVVEKQINRYKELVVEQGGKVLRIDNWGLRRMAYTINKKPKATYIYMQYLAGGAIVSEMERTMRLSEEVIRYLTVLVDGAVDPTARPDFQKVTKHEPVEERMDPRRDQGPRSTAPTPMSPATPLRSDELDEDDDDDDSDRRPTRSDYRGGRHDRDDDDYNRED